MKAAADQLNKIVEDFLGGANENLNWNERPSPDKLNRQIIRVLANYPPDRHMIKCDNTKNSVTLYTVGWLANEYLKHLVHHLRQTAPSE